MLHATTACTFSTSQLPKVIRERCALYILTSKCASQHNGVHSQLPKVVRTWFAHVDFQMCLAPQRRALFERLNFPKWSEPGVLRATTACNFSSRIWPHGSAPAALVSLLFDPPGPQIIGKTWKNTVNRDFATCSRTCIFFLLTLSLLYLL